MPKNPQHSPPPLPPTLRRGGPGPPPLPPVEVNSEGPKDPRTPPKRAVAGPEGPRPDLSPSGCGPRPFARTSPQISKYMKNIQSAAKLRARHRAGANIKQTTTQNHEKSSENNGPKPFKNQPQIDQKSIENQPKIDPKSIKNPPKIDQKSTRSEKCRALRLGSRLGGVLEESKGPT